MSMLLDTFANAQFNELSETLESTKNTLTDSINSVQDTLSNEIDNSIYGASSHVTPKNISIKVYERTY